MGHTFGFATSPLRHFATSPQIDADEIKLLAVPSITPLFHK
jgi:hypothetical protein